MKLKEWIKRKGMRRNELADLVGARDWTVQLWIDNETSPSLLFALRVKNITKGKVKLEDLLSFKHQRKWEIYDGSQKSKRRITKEN